ncbi:MAG: ABC-2 transporter permease [Acidobacteriota bacterium]|nr:ABC-2 transporter permease [Acidobacteriota bacterium]
MIKLFRKDFILHKKFVLGVGLVYPLYIGYMGSRIGRTTLLPVLCAFLYVIVPFVLFGREDKFKAETFTLSLPVTRREYLRARFLLSWILMLLMFAAGSLLMAVVPGAKLPAATVFGPRMVLSSLAFIAVYFGLLMPLFVRFGQAGLLVFLVVLQITGVLLMVFRSSVGIGLIKTLFRLVPNAVAEIQAAFGPAPAVFAVLSLLALFSYGSFSLSLALFRRKEY